MNELQQLTSNQPMSQEDIMINILQTQKRRERACKYVGKPCE